MILTAEQKLAGRAFRRQCQERLAAYPRGDAFVSAFCPPFIVWYRHKCKRASTWALHLRQHYWPSPEYWACYCGVVEPFVKYQFPHADCQGGKLFVPDGLFAFIWREGTCSRCGFTVRSETGRFCLAASNPPEKGAVVGFPH